MLVYIKFAALLLISSIIICSSGNVSQASTNNQLQNSIANKPTNDPIKFQINDPNDPPYIFQAVAFQNQAKIFVLTFPDGLPTTTTDTFVEAHVSRKDDIRETIELSAAQGNCNLANYSADTTLSQATKWTIITINNIVFNKGTVGLSSSFPIYTYTWQQNNYCFCLVFKFETGIAFENQPPPPPFRVKAEEKNMQTVLQSIQVNPK